MQQLTKTSADTPAREDEFVTIIAPSIAAVMQQFKNRGLAAQGFAIAGRVGRHSFAYAGDGADVDLFGGDRMIAATFIRAATTQ